MQSDESGSAEVVRSYLEASDFDKLFAAIDNVPKFCPAIAVENISRVEITVFVPVA